MAFIMETDNQRQATIDLPFFVNNGRKLNIMRCSQRDGHLPNLPVWL